MNAPMKMGHATWRIDTDESVNTMSNYPDPAIN
jgi:hypothetical protein